MKQQYFPKIRWLITPLFTFVAVFLAGLVLQFLMPDPPFRDWMGSIRNIGFILIFVWMGLSWKQRLMDSIIVHHRDRTSVELFGRVITLILLFAAGLAILRTIGFDIVPLLTFGGVGAAVLGFASRELFGNYFGGLTLYMTRPFAVGEQIEIPDKKISGQVEQIGWYYTSLRDERDRPIFIPNSVFLAEIVVNISTALDAGWKLKKLEKSEPTHHYKRQVNVPRNRVAQNQGD